jgi:hypothetical protein
MDRKTYLAKVTKEMRNQNIAKLYFHDDLSTTQIQKDYPELSKSRIAKIAYNYRNKYGQN